MTGISRASPYCPTMPLGCVSVIASLLWPGVLSRPARTSFHIQFGDLPTWLLAVFALGALIAAGFAYFEQRKAGGELASQVKLQGDALADQRTATTALADQVELQRSASAALAAQVSVQQQALEDQRKANALQARVLEQQLGALVRRQAELIGLARSTYDGEPAGLKRDTYHGANVTNGSGRPVRNVVCMLQRQQNGGLEPARNVGQSVHHSAAPGAGGSWTVFDEWHHDDKIRLLGRGETWVFVFPVVADSQAILTLRFTDDAGLHWQVHDDLHLEQLFTRIW